MLPDDLLALGFKLIERNDRYLLVSGGYGVAAGATLGAAISQARSLASFIRWCIQQKRT